MEAALLNLRKIIEKPLKEKRTSLDHGPKDRGPNAAYLDPIVHGPNDHEKSGLDHIPNTIYCT
jgi:hypothetical protein